MPGRLVGVTVDADGAPGLPPGAADPRAAHPPREGDEQHLHRAGAARRDRRRCTPPTTAPTGCTRSPSAPTTARASLAAGLRAMGVGGAHDDVLRHRALARARAGREAIVAAALARGHQPPARRRRHRLGVAPTRPPREHDLEARVARLRRRARRRSALADPTRAGRRRHVRHPAPSRAHVAVPHAPGVHHPPQRDGDAALPAPARRPRHRARPRDDPAGLVHDEAQRHHRDGADHLAGVRRHPPVRAAATRPTGYLELIRSLEAWLVEITGYDAVSLQPNAGSQGEFAGLLAIRAYHRRHGERGPRRVPDPEQRPRHQRRERRHGRHAGGRGRVRRRRQRRPRRPAGEDRRARRPTSPR